MDALIDIWRFRLFAWSEWGQWWNHREWNWTDFHVLWLHVENGAYKDSFEVNVGLLGLCVSVDWYYGEKE